MPAMITRANGAIDEIAGASRSALAGTDA